MACSSITLAGINTSCRDNLSGIRTVYLAKYESVASTTVTTNAISAVTMETGGKFYTYKFAKNTGSMTTTVESDNAAGYVGFNTELSLQFSKMDTAKRLEFTSMCLDDFCAIVEDQNHRFWFLGYDNPVTCSTGTITTGQQYNEFSGYQITLNDLSKLPPYEVTASAMETLASSIVDPPTDVSGN